MPTVGASHVIVLPGGGYAEHSPHESTPVPRWLNDNDVSASVFRYPLQQRHPIPLQALRAEIAQRRDAGETQIGLMGFSAGGHLAGLAALAPQRAAPTGNSHRTPWPHSARRLSSLDTGTLMPRMTTLVARSTTAGATSGLSTSRSKTETLQKSSDAG